jgi:hypothetical protein
MSSVAKWAVVSAATLVTVELVLTRSGHGTYTGLYRKARTGPCGLVPVAAAVVVFAHLEGWLPEKLDPFAWGARPWT